MYLIHNIAIGISSSIKKIKLYPYFIPCKKINFIWVRDLSFKDIKYNIQAKNIQENIDIFQGRECLSAKQETEPINEIMVDFLHSMKFSRKHYSIYLLHISPCILLTFCKILLSLFNSCQTSYCPCDLFSLYFSTNFNSWYNSIFYLLDHFQNFIEVLLLMYNLVAQLPMCQI